MSKTPPTTQAMPPTLRQVTIGRGFWGRRVQTNRRVTLPLEFDICRQTGRLDSLRLAWKPGDPQQPHPFWDSDIAKWLEAACYSLTTHPNAALATQVDEAAALIAAAQQPDGYLNTYFTVVKPGERWTNLYRMHELYCAGHLMEAAVAHFEATGQRLLLDALGRYADHIAQQFGIQPHQKPGYCGHPEIELALVKLAAATGEDRHLRLAQYFLDQRGQEPLYFLQEYQSLRASNPSPPPLEPDCQLMQAHAPLRRQRDAVGHAVRACYLYSGMADIARLTSDASLWQACRRLWDSVTQRRMYVIGGVGSSANGERFTFDHDLPNDTAYAETCANIALVFFAQRMLQADLDRRYGDVMERALYNGVLSGVSLDGKRFFYANRLDTVPAAWVGARDHLAASRQGWFNCACCPPNLARLLASLGRYLYASGPDLAVVHLYANSSAALPIAGQTVRITQETDYPWDGRVQVTLGLEREARFTLALRVPGWCSKPALKVNGRTVRLRSVLRRGYAHIRRPWRDGDRVELLLPMDVQRVRAHPSVRQDCGRVALQRGPLVYCLEQADHGPDLSALSLPADARLKAVFKPRLLGGTVVIQARGRRVNPAPWKSELYTTSLRAAPARPVTLTAVPYCLWNNRGEGEMQVWIREG